MRWRASYELGLWLKKPRLSQVQAQFGPDFQEIGGFWLSAASALANGELAVPSRAVGLKPGEPG